MDDVCNSVSPCQIYRGIVQLVERRFIEKVSCNDRVGELAETSGLLNRRPPMRWSEGSNPSPAAINAGVIATARNPVLKTGGTVMSGMGLDTSLQRQQR